MRLCRGLVGYAAAPARRRGGDGYRLVTRARPARNPGTRGARLPCGRAAHPALWLFRAPRPTPGRYAFESQRLRAAERDFERGSHALVTRQPERAGDRVDARPHVAEPVAGRRLVGVEAVAVVAHADEARPVAASDRNLGPVRVRVLADVGEPLLHDPEHLDLLVWCEIDALLELEVDLEHAVRREELDVAPQRRLERRLAAGRREREDGEARLLLRESCGLLDPRQHLVDVGTGAQAVHVRREGEEVLREAVVDLARDPRPLLRDGAPELGAADRPPHADEQQAERES